jgi:Holliday junction DNA helicase RuvA
VLSASEPEILRQEDQSSSEEKMFAKLRGIVDEIDVNVVTLDVHGVGYELFCSGGCVARLERGSEATIVVFTDVNENSIRLYGFADPLEKQVFLLLTTVKGVGSRTGMEIVSRVDKVELLRAIGAGDLQRLQSIKGVGKKTSERIVVELKDRVAAYALERHESRLHIERESSTPFEEACEALEALGFTRKDAERAVAQVQGKGTGPKTDSASVVKEALRYI